MNQWIVDNKKDWKIKYVLHTGDITDDYDMETQWKNADTAMKIFDDAGMPYGVLAGNHDVGAGLENYQIIKNTLVQTDLKTKIIMVVHIRIT